jgi:hypothetical protein
MNKPAFIFDGRLLVDAEKLTKIGFKVSEPPSDGVANSYELQIGDLDWTRELVDCTFAHRKKDLERLVEIDTHDIGFFT